MATVRIYRNLGPTKAVKNAHPGKTEFMTISKNGISIEVVPELIAFDCDFHVGESGRLRVIEKRRKNVHSWVKAKKYRITNSVDISGMEELYYDPYFTQHYYSLVTGDIITHAAVVACKNGRCYAGGVNGLVA